MKTNETKPTIELTLVGADGKKHSRTFIDNKFASRGQQLAGWAEQNRKEWFKEESAAN